MIYYGCKYSGISCCMHVVIIYMWIQQTCSIIFFLSAKQDEWKPAFRLTRRCGLWLGYKISFLKNKQTKNKLSAIREWAWQHEEWEEEATKHRAEKKDEHVGRLKSFFLREINTMHKILCICNAVYVYIMCMVITVHAICEGLSNHLSVLIIKVQKG